VEPDYLVYAIKTPNDPKMIDLWGLHNSGQTGGNDDKDIDAFEAWDLQTGSKDVLVGVIDTGVDRTHVDLAANMWTNEKEIPGNGKDDDGNGFVDDVHGWDFYDNDNNPTDGGSHGTHCAGTIGAVGNNGKGVVGVSWNVSMVGIRFLGPMGGYTSDAVKSINYATKIGVALTSNSWGGGGFSSSLKNAIDNAGKKGIGFVAAAGNSAYDNDSVPSYPSSYDSENIISVGAHDHKGKIAWFSQWGKKSVDLFAPGVNVVSTVPGNKYASFNGTSMATPHVSGAYATILASHPTWTVVEVKNALLNSTDPETGLANKCVTGGRLNLHQALSEESPEENLISVTPSDIDLGIVSINQPAEFEFILSNPGNAKTTVDKAYIAANSDSLKNLIGHWKLDGNAQDSSGHGHDGEVFNATPTIDRFGNPNQAYAFDGDEDYIDISHSNTLNTLPLSVSVWFNASEKNERGGIVSKYIAAHWNGWQIATYNNLMKPWYLRGHYHGVIGEYGEEPFETELSSNTWNHIVTIFDDEGGRIYKNGNLIDSHNWRGAPGKCTTNTSLQIGRYRTYDPSKHPHADFNGAIDDVRIYGSSLSEKEVSSLYNNETESSPFSVSLETPLELEPAFGIAGKIKFSSNEEGLHQANLVVESNAKNEPKLVIPLVAEVTTTPILEASPNSMHFGLMQDEKKTQNLSLSNLGDGVLNFTVSVEDADWLAIDSKQGSIDPAGNVKIEVNANASLLTEDSATAYIVIESNDAVSPKTVITVTADKLGAGKGLAFIPGVVKFTETFVGQVTESPLSILNAGTERITVSKFVFMNSSFSHTLKLPFDLEAGEKLDSTIFFKPGKTGDFKSSALLLTSSFEPYKFEVSGQAVIAPALAYSPGQISESLNANEEKTISFKINNTGGSSLSWSIKGATTELGSSFKLGKVFGMEHFVPLEKGASDNRMGSPISTLGGGPDFHGYSWTDSNDPSGPDYKWNDISASGELLVELSKMDDGNQEIQLPFAVSFYGKEFEKAYVNSNGYLTLGNPSNQHGHFPLPSTMMPGNLIAPMAMDLNPAKGGKIYVKKTGDRITVQYDKVKDFAGLGEYTFQTVLQSNGVIFFHYLSIPEGVKPASTGIQNETGDAGLLVGYNNDQIESEMSVRVSTAPKWLHISKSSGAIDAGQSESLEIRLKAGMILTGNYESILNLTSNDPKNLKSEVPVALTVKASKLLTTNPAQLNFGNVEVGLSKTLEFSISNKGNAPVSLSSLKLQGAAFSSNLSATSLKPGASKTVNITFKPTKGGDYQSVSSLTSDADDAPHSIKLTGNGIASPKLQVTPETVSISVDAGSKGSIKAVIDNVKGMAPGSFEVVEIRSGKTSSSLSGFNEDSQNSSETVNEDPFSSEHVADELIVAFKEGTKSFVSPNNIANDIVIVRPIGKAMTPGTGVKALTNGSLSLIRNESKMSLRELADQLAQDPSVDYVEPNYIVRHSGVPNDPKWNKQWALPKIDAAKAWDSAVGSDSVIVAVIDTGIDYNHPDLQGNIWKNPGEIAGNKIDDDGNGYVDDVYGWDFCNKDNNPMDGDSHGTHVAGTIAAATNNGVSVAGVSWHASLVALKFLSDEGWGSVADAIDAVAYCAAMDFPISNNSWGGGGYSQAMKDAIAAAANKGHLFCAAAGNSATDNDKSPHYPSNYDLPSVLSVAASNSSDKLAWFSCFGHKTVDLAAPGEGILSLVPNGGTASYSGTSMATPHVAGAAALLLSINPDFGHQELKNSLMNTVDPIPSFDGKMVAPGRLNLANAVGVASPGWLSVSPGSGSVPEGEKKDLLFTADATDFTAGTKTAVVVLNTNDPLASVIEVPVELTVTGSPVIELSEKSLDFGTLWTNEMATRMVEVKNVGTDTLKVSALNFGNGVFTTELNAFILSPGKAQSLAIQAEPLSSGNITSTLEINSNDQKNPVMKVTLQVKGVTPPSLSFNPASIFLTLEKGLSEERKITITNSGEAAGEWDAYMVEIGADKSNKMDMANVLKSISSRASTPEVSSPRLLAMDAVQIANLGDPQPVVHFKSNPESSLEIAILGAAFDYENEDIANGLVATNNFGGVTMINVSMVTPTLEELSAFDSILVYSIDPYKDAKSLGNVVSEYALSGGGVVTASHESNTHSLQGEWVKQKLNVYEHDDNYKEAKHSMGNVLIEGHPILAKVKSFKGNSLHARKKNPLNGKIVSKWTDGSPLVTIRNGNEKIVDLSFWPVSDKAHDLGYFSGWDSSTDGWQLIANSLSWATLGSTPEWLNGTPLSDNVEGNSLEDMVLTIDAKNLEVGDYFAEIQFTSNDPFNSFTVVEVNLTVKENQPPVAHNTKVHGVEDQVLDFTLEATDPDGDKLTYEILSGPQNGLITGNGSELNYVPDPNFNGNDSLTFKVSDGSLESNLAEVIFVIEAVNDAPIAVSDEINGTEDEFIIVEFKHSDPDGDELNIQITASPENGFLWEENGMTLYFPNNHYNGNDEIRFTVTDGELSSEEGIIMINLEATNDAPVAEELYVETQQNQFTLITLAAEDIDGDNVSFDIITDPNHGTVSQMSKDTWKYTPNPQFTGTDDFLYRAKDSSVQSNLAKVTINVKEENNAPVLQDSTFSMKEDGSLPIKLVASDPEGDELTFTILEKPSMGKLTGNGPKYEYTPNANFNGTDQFTVKANDGMLDSNTATIRMVVNSENDAPSFVKSINTMSSGLRETPFRMKVEVEDVDNDELSLSVAKDPENGVCYFDNQHLVFLPKLGFEGIDNIELELSDGTETVKQNFQVNIASHADPIVIHGNLEKSPQLLDMLYQANEKMVANNNRIFEYSTDLSSSTLTANLSTELLEGAMTLNNWIDQINNGVIEKEYVFAATDTANGLSWEVAIFSDSVSSVDTELNDVNSSTDSNEEKKSDNSSTNEENNQEATVEKEVSTSNDTETIEQNETDMVTPGQDTAEPHTDTEFITELGSGWYEAPGIGTFYDAGNGWIYEANMGWSFLKVCPTNCSAWLFNENLGWLWFSADLPNMVFSNNAGVSSWIFFPENTLGESLLIFDYTQTAWMQWK
jgi:subtilisin family serine protease